MILPTYIPWEDVPSDFPFHPHNSKEIPKQKLLVKGPGAHLPGGPVGEILDSLILQELPIS